MIQKLYNPVFCKIYASEDYYSDTPETLSQREAVDYVDKITLLAYKENETLGRERGLMEYYGENDSVDRKVKSLFINFEVINRELWGVTTIDVTERLNPQEMGLLKDYITGQMSDGFGEGFEQRDIKTEDGDLYVSLWDSGDEFYIYTAQEFSDRFGIELSEVTEELRTQLMERIDRNIADFDKTNKSGVIEKEEFGKAMESAYYVMSTYRDYTSDWLRCLLEFANPLEIVADRVRGSTPTMYDFAPVLDLIYTNRQWYKENYATADAIPAVEEKSDVINELRGQLIERGEKNWEDYRHSPHNTTPDTLFNTSVEVINRRNAYVFIKDYQDFTAEQLNCLLQFANPVELVSDYLDPMSDGSELPSILSSILEKQAYYKEHYVLAETPAVDDKLADLRSQLIEKVETEYKQYHNDLFNLSTVELSEKSDYTAAIDSAYKYFTEYKNYTAEDLGFLSTLSIPLVIVADQVYEMSEENVGFPMILDFLKDNYADIYTEKPDQFTEEAAEMTEVETAKLQEQLNKRVDKNFKDYRDSLKDLSSNEIIDISQEIYAVNEAYYSLTNNSDFDKNQLEFLLKFENPLEIFADYWKNEMTSVHLYEVTDMIFGDTSKVEDCYKMSDKPPLAAEKSDKTEGGQRKAEKFFSGVVERWDEYVKNNPIVKETPDKTAIVKPDKELTGMAKLRQSEKEKTNKTEKVERQKGKSKRRHTHRKFGRDN